jgi:hypothetical protein
VYEPEGGTVGDAIGVAGVVGGIAGWISLLPMFFPDPGLGWLNTAIPLLLLCWPIGVVAGIRQQRLSGCGARLLVAVVSPLLVYTVVGVAWLATFLLVAFLRYPNALTSALR